MQSSMPSCSDALVLASVFIFPALHGSHDDKPALLAIFPAVHMAHAVAAGVEIARPTGQSLQATEPAAEAYAPARQSPHSSGAVLWLEKRPGLHWEQDRMARS